MEAACKRYGDAVVEFRVQRTIAAPQEQVFDWLADPANLKAATLILRVTYAKGSPPLGVGAIRNVIAAGMWLREKYTTFDAPLSYSYRIVRAVPPINHEGGSLTLTADGGGTHVDWVTEYTHPAWVGGKALEAVTCPLIRKGFVEILEGCATALEKS